MAKESIVDLESLKYYHDTIAIKSFISRNEYEKLLKRIEDIESSLESGVKLRADSRADC